MCPPVLSLSLSPHTHTHTLPAYLKQLNPFLIHPDFEVINPSTAWRTTTNTTTTTSAATTATANTATRDKLRENCYYHGKVDGQPNSFVALRTCDNVVSLGLMGAGALGSLPLMI